jgi:hypothetical protein
VAAFVLPERMPVVDDERQLPMFPDPRVDLLIRLLGNAVEAARTQSAIIQSLTQADRDRRDGHPVPRRLHQPQNKALREWHTFRAHFVALERSVRRDNELQPGDEVTKEMLYAAGGPPPKTMTRHQEYHGLRADQWPPSTWPKDPPLRPEDKN